MKEKVLIVNNNMQIGGIQKSLINLLNATASRYDITLLLFSDYGELYEQIPDGVDVVFAHKRLQVLGTPWSCLKGDIGARVHKVISQVINRFWGKRLALKYLFKKQDKISGFEHVISFSHCTSENNVSVCTPEFVLECTESIDKICFIHCDYKNSDTFSEHNNNIYGQFNKIACCSGAVRERFALCAPELSEKAYIVENFYDMTIPKQAELAPFGYNERYINVVIVARLSQEKGALRAVKALARSNRDDVKLFIVGDGPEKDAIMDYIQHNHMEQKVVLMGEQKNPYRFMVNADYLLVPSYHEAAPMVFDEAKILGVTIITTNTTSAMEMVGSDGIVIENSDEALWKVFEQVKKVPKERCKKIDNRQKFVMLEGMLNGRTI